MYHWMRELLTRAVGRLPRDELPGLRRVLWSLRDIPWWILWLERYYPDLFRQKPVSIEMVDKGLGSRGSFPIPPHIWNSLVDPSLLPTLLAHSHEFPSAHSCPSTLVRRMVHLLCRDGFLLPSSELPNCSLFLLPKSSSKCSLIADLRFLNSFTPQPLPRFHLPSMVDIAGVMSSFPCNSLWATTLDLSNFFWSLELPPDFRSIFRVAGASYPNLPFGWNLSPIISQTTLIFLVSSALLDAGFLPFLTASLFFFIYLDDVIIISSSYFLCQACTEFVVTSLKMAGFVISPKSRLTPSRHVTWIGKFFDFSLSRVSNTESAMTRAIAITLMGSVLPMTEKRLDILLGVMNWAYRPLPGLSLFSTPWYRWRWNGSRYKGVAPRCLRALFCDSLLLAYAGWRAPPFRPAAFLSPILCCDAAFIRGHFRAGLYSPSMGGRLVPAPPWVTSQQTCEYFALIESIKLALHLGFPAVTIVGDNLASLFSFLKFKPFWGHIELSKHLRALFNFMWQHPLHVTLIWAPSALQPADPISRCPGFDPSHLTQALFDAEARFTSMMASLFALREMGVISFAPPVPAGVAEVMSFPL